jgi:polyhydroxybutyrate depolymerase
VTARRTLRRSHRKGARRAPGGRLPVGVRAALAGLAALASLGTVSCTGAGEPRAASPTTASPSTASPGGAAAASGPATTATGSTASGSTARTGAEPFDPYAGARPAVTATGARREGTLVTPDGRTRTYRTYVPASRASAAPLPLLVALHGGFGTGAQFELSSRFDALAEANGYVVVYPDGVGSRLAPDLVQTWNGGGCCGPAVSQQVDDVTFVRLLIDQVARDTGADTTKVVVAGHSNGAILAHRLSCELADRLMAIGVQAGGLEVASCTPVRPVSVLHLHGLADTNVPFAGGVGSGAAGVAFRPVRETMDAHVRADGCATTPVVQAAADPAVVATTWGSCTAGAVVRLVTVEDASHAWMGSDRGTSGLAGTPSTRLDASRAIIAFFQRVLGR